MPSPQRSFVSDASPLRCVDCVVVNWNGGQLIRECVESVQTFGHQISRLFLVDNGSTDGSIGCLPEHNRLNVIETGQNLGFAKACNLGAGFGSSRYILFLNPDARLVDYSLKHLIHFMDSAAAKSVGICGAQLIDEYDQIQESCFNFTDTSTYIGHALGLDGKLKPFLTPTRSQIDYTKSQYVDQPIGAFFLIRRALFEELSGFDEQFFVYYEEVDLALRAKQIGWKSYFFAQTVAYHKGGGVSERVKPLRLFYSLRSRLLYASKHFSRSGFLLTTFLTLCIEPITRIVRGLLRFSWLEVSDTAKAYRLLYANFSKIAHSIQRPAKSIR